MSSCLVLPKGEGEAILEKKDLSGGQHISERKKRVTGASSRLTSGKPAEIEGKRMAHRGALTEPSFLRERSIAKAGGESSRSRK